MTTEAKRFKIIWRDGAYHVSIPNYEGGEVVDAAIHDRDQETIQRLQEQLKTERHAGRHSLWQELVETLMKRGCYASTDDKQISNIIGDVAVALDKHQKTIRELLEAAKQATDCRCTIQERMSGHHVDCYAPGLEAAISRAEEGLSGIGR